MYNRSQVIKKNVTCKSLESTDVQSRFITYNQSEVAYNELVIYLCGVK